MNLTHIESRSSKDTSKTYDFFVSCNSQSGDLKSALDELRALSTKLTVYAHDGVNANLGDDTNTGKITYITSQKPFSLKLREVNDTVVNKGRYAMCD